MSFAELDLFGVYLAKFALILVAAWIGTIAIRRVVDRLGLLRFVWHPPLFTLAIYLIMLSCMTMTAVGR